MTKVTFDNCLHIEVAYSWKSETSSTLVLQIDENQWTSTSMPREDELPDCILSLDFVSEEEFGL